MTRARTSLLVPALLLVSATALSACGAPRSETQSPATTQATAASGASSANPCAPDQLALVKDGTLTIGTDKPAYPPWFIDDDPSNGKGYESAVAYAIAEKLGFDKAEVTWTTVTFDQAIAPGKKGFDFDVNQVSVSDKRKKVVDFSSGYYDVRQTVVTTKGSSIDGKTSVADLKDAKLGAQIGTTSLDAIENQIQPTKKPAVFNTNDLAVQALKSKQIDGIVVDLPTAYYVTAAQLDNGVIVGQLPKSDGAVEQFGAVLPKGSTLTTCVTQAVDALRADGTLDEIATKWLTESGAPELS